MALIMLDEKERAAAQDYDDKVMAKVDLKGPNYTGLHVPGRFFAGRCGEIAFRKWAISKGLRFEETVRDDGESDKQDFILYAKKSGRPCAVNVKCSLHPNAHYLMQPQTQHMLHRQDMYVAAKGEDDGVRVAIILAGAVTRKVFDEQAEECMVKIPTLKLLLADLTYSMERIANSFEKRRAT
jgi:hypothetical protein